MLPPDDPVGGCRHDRAPLKRIGKVRRGKRVLYLLLCTECGHPVSTDEVRWLREAGSRPRRRPPATYPFWWVARGTEPLES